ncbi:Mrp/NBP35 family ATP-binding protein [uncultured Megasphaera sp.]|jgi:Mrp family chromosome partitioning ATPase|uniref:Mrp/NBP35 family ATP-binding protein n=1 Tax=uncultured Megasphaera sp. TaxID=165188 RepID=UPI0025DC2CFD|nr:Mrp/NBP35 family ATP-binding protein [uncultured Megasphaera sp.]
MSENCNHDCSSCASNCESRTEPQSLLAKPHEGTHVKHVIAVVSGKGGVGKSLVTSLMAVQMHRRGFKTAILDADITGPSIPKVFGITDRATGSEAGINPVVTKGGIEVMSMNVLLEDSASPVVWRGPVISGAVKQFWTDVLWGDIDYMFVDMPPGTGDVPLTVFQSLPVDGILVVTSPQELVSLIVEKALKMSELMHIPVLGLIENMSYFECPNCHEKVEIYGPSRVDESAQKYGISHTAKLPIDPAFAAHCDKGDIESYQADYLSDTAAFLEGVLGK